MHFQFICKILINVKELEKILGKLRLAKDMARLRLSIIRF
jgi:hypothetical protein